MIGETNVTVLGAASLWFQAAADLEITEDNVIVLGTPSFLRN